MKNILKNYLIDSILLIILGCILLFKPEGIMEILITLIGIIIIVMGAFRCILNLFKEKKNWIVLVIGIIEIILGIVFIIKKDLFIGFLSTIIGIIILIGGLLIIKKGFDTINNDSNSFKYTLLLGVINIILSIFVFTNLKTIAKIQIQIMGISLIIEGISMMSLLYDLKKDIIKEIEE